MKINLVENRKSKMNWFRKSLFIFFIINTLLLSSLVFAADEAKPNAATDDDDIVPPVTEAPVEEDIEFDENGVPKLKPHADIDAVFKFTKPDGLSQGLELPSAEEVQFLIGIKNNGNKDFVVQTIDASLRYPQDFSVNIQNFTAYPYNRVVKPSQEITIAYSFMIHEMFNDRPFGFLVNLLYQDLEGKLYSNAVFNQTVNIIELNDGLLNMEILFVYVFLLALAGLVLFGIYYYSHFYLAKKLGGKTKKKTIETGTVNNKIDFEWIPEQHLNNNKSPKVTPKTRKAKKAD